MRSNCKAFSSDQPQIAQISQNLCNISNLWLPRRWPAYLMKFRPSGNGSGIGNSRNWLCNGLTVSPDESWLLVSAADAGSGDLRMVENKSCGSLLRRNSSCASPGRRLGVATRQSKLAILFRWNVTKTFDTSSSAV
jgi:hypothetical protein